MKFLQTWTWSVQSPLRFRSPCLTCSLRNSFCMLLVQFEFESLLKQCSFISPVTKAWTWLGPSSVHFPCKALGCAFNILLKDRFTFNTYPVWNSPSQNKSRRPKPVPKKEWESFVTDPSLEIEHERERRNKTSAELLLKEAAVAILQNLLRRNCNFQSTGKSQWGC